MRVLTVLGITALLLFTFACGGEKSESNKEVAAKSNVVVVEVTGNDLMQFNVKTIEVLAGSKVKVNFSHIGKMESTVMGHNFIILKPGVDIVQFATAAMTAKDTDYIPADKEGDIIAHTKLLGGGQSTSIEFDAPAVGTYKFLCSFPGHYAMMQGDFIVK